MLREKNPKKPRQIFIIIFCLVQALIDCSMLGEDEVAILHFFLLPFTGFHVVCQIEHTHTHILYI